MSGFENYREEIARIDREIRHHAAVCGVDPDDRVALEQATIARQGRMAPDLAWENLRGLLILRLLVETEMTELGLTVPPSAGPAEKI
ncbi:MAG TPA: hypothetical protein VFH22_07825 [Rhodocyclaceae bacterium]|nr:hypothetical protein [Rhodocyclaceae bacterium]